MGVRVSEPLLFLLGSSGEKREAAGGGTLVKPNPYSCLRTSAGLKLSGRSYFAGWHGLFAGGELKCGRSMACLHAGIAGTVASMNCGVCLSVLCCIENNPGSVFGVVGFNSINTTV